MRARLEGAAANSSFASFGLLPRQRGAVWEGVEPALIGLAVPDDAEAFADQVYDEQPEAREYARTCEKVTQQPRGNGVPVFPPNL
jgi:hypothetical protein